MADYSVLEARLARAGLNQEQVKAALDENAADLDGFQQWAESVHDTDIATKFGGADAQTADPEGEGHVGDPDGNLT